MDNASKEKASRKILYLEDSKVDFELLQEFMFDNGFEQKMAHAETEQEFVSALKNNKYDVILCDFNLLNFDAFGALKISAEICPETPVIVVSGNISEETAIELINQGAVDYVYKDKPERLPYAVKRVIQEADKKAALRLSEKKLIESEEKYRALSENLVDALFMIDTQYKFTYVNNYAAALLNSSKKEIIGQKIDKLFPPQEFQHMIANIKKVFIEKKIIIVENIFNSLGNELWLDTRLIPIFDENNNVRTVYGVSRDITKRKKDEIELKMLSTAIEQSIEALIITDLNGIIQYVNPAFEKISGYSYAEAIGKKPSILKSDMQDESVYEELWNKISSGHVWRGNLINKCKDGRLYTEEARISPLVDFDGKITHYVGTKRNITKEMDLQQQLIQSQKLEALGTLTGGIAHDFNNMLTIIKSYCEFMQKKISDNTELNQSVLRIDEAATKAAALTSQLLAFGRKQVLRMSTVDLNELIKDVRSIMKRLLGEEYPISTELKANPSLVKADYYQIEQIIMNLCVNARDAMPHGGKIIIRTRNVENRVALIVEDTGEGIAPEILPRIFEPFFTTKTVNKGTGLGLSVIFGIVKQHQGEISVESTPGEGSIFKIELKPSKSEMTKSKNLLNDNVYKGGRCILFLEDDDMIREITQMNLEEENFTVFSADSIKTADSLFELHRNEIDIVFSDVVLPDGSGLDFVDRVSVLNKNMIIILTSGYTDEKSHLERIMHKGFNFIQKPYKICDIIKSISAGNNEEVE